MIRRRSLSLVLLFLTFVIFIGGIGSIGSNAGCNQPTEPTLEITPDTASVMTGSTLQLVVTRHYPAGPAEQANDRVTYSTSNRSAATISDKGFVTIGADPGTLVIRVFDKTSYATATTTLTITTPTIESIEIAPSPSIVLHPNVAALFKATAHLSNGTLADVTKSVTWQSSNTSVATVVKDASDTIVIVPVAPGDATITATDPNTLLAGRTSVIVTSGTSTLTALIVTPNPGTIGIGVAKQAQFSAEGIFADGTSEDLTKTVTWSSSNLAIATIDANGIATGLVAGDVTITASASNGTIKGSAAAKVQ